MMNYEIFKEVVKEKFMDYMPEKFKGMELVAEPVEKVNVTLDGIILREEGRNISPTIYINDMYKKYQDCDDLEETLMAACDFIRSTGLFNGLFHTGINLHQIFIFFC